MNKFNVNCQSHKARPHKNVPPESVKDNRVITVNGIWVVGWQTNIAQLHLIARDPMVHHSKARIKGRPSWKSQMVNYIDLKAVYLNKQTKTQVVSIWQTTFSQRKPLLVKTKYTHCYKKLFLTYFCLHFLPTKLTFILFLVLRDHNLQPIFPDYFEQR